MVFCILLKFLLHLTTLHQLYQTLWSNWFALLPWIICLGFRPRPKRQLLWLRFSSWITSFHPDKS